MAKTDKTDAPAPRQGGFDNLSLKDREIRVVDFCRRHFIMGHSYNVVANLAEDAFPTFNFGAKPAFTIQKWANREGGWKQLRDIKMSKVVPSVDDSETPKIDSIKTALNNGLRQGVIGSSIYVEIISRIHELETKDALNFWLQICKEQAKTAALYKNDSTIIELVKIIGSAVDDMFKQMDVYCDRNRDGDVKSYQKMRPDEFKRSLLVRIKDGLHNNKVQTSVKSIPVSELVEVG